MGHAVHPALHGDLSRGSLRQVVRPGRNNRHDSNSNHCFPRSQRTMTIYRFGRFEFDAIRHELHNNGVSVGLRPKTLILLGVLIQHREQPLKHQELLDRVWPRTQAGTNNLFQAISELRSALKPLNPIRTIPNLGYAWCMPIRQKRNWMPAAAVAGLVLFVATSMTLTRPAQIPSASNLPPAYRAFFAGMDHLDNGKPEQAAAQFELAIAENPDFSEAHLLLAQSLMLADKLDQARIVLGQLLHADRARNDPYAEMTAMELMGQIDQKTGAIGPTLEWTRQAFENAETSGYICAAADLESRLIDVQKMLTGNDEVLAEPGLAEDQEPLPEFCGDMPPWLESGAVENCDWNVGAIAGLAGPAFGIASFGGSHTSLPAGGRRAA